MEGEKSTRLSGPNYKRVFDKGRVIRGRLMSAWVLSEANAGRQAGVVVSKKTFHTAVERNRAKRIMREGFRLAVKAGKLPSDSLWVLCGRTQLGTRTSNDVIRELKWMRHSLHADVSKKQDGADSR